MTLPDFDMVLDHPRRSDAVVILPVYNEMPVLTCTLSAIRTCWDGDLLVVDDGSTDGSAEFLREQDGIILIRNRENAGAGGVLLRGFEIAAARGYVHAVTMDSDGQHNAIEVHDFLGRIVEEETDMIWGTRYPGGYTPLAEPFRARQEVNRDITARLNRITGWDVTDSFCGFRAYRVEPLSRLDVRETGYGMLLELAVLAWDAGFRMAEHPVPLIYLDETRDFQNEFRDASERRAYYHRVIDAALVRTGRPAETGRDDD